MKARHLIPLITSAVLAACTGSLPRVVVDWGRELTIDEVLPRDPTAVARVGVRRRGPTPETPAPAGMRITRRCDPRTCTDGLESVDGSQIYLRSELTADEREEVVEAGSWLERWVRATYAGDRFISFLVGAASFSAGAAHSNADLECRTARRDTGARVSLAEALGEPEARRLLEGVRDFLQAERELEVRARDLSPPGGEDFILEADGSVGFCLRRSVENRDGIVTLVRAAFANAGERPPVSATTRLMRQIATGERPLPRLVDHGRGVLLIEHHENPGDGPTEIQRTRHLCGTELQQQLVRWHTELSAALKSPTAEALPIRCSNTGGHSCTLPGIAGEPSIRYLFAEDTARGLQLEAVVVVSESTMTDAYARAAEVFIQTALDRGRERRCEP